jgi:hypothetical protein
MADETRTKSESMERKRRAPKESGDMTDVEPNTEFEQEANLVVSSKDWKTMLARTTTLEQENRDREEDIERERGRLTEIRQLAFNKNTAIASMLKVLNAEGEHKDMVRVMVVKKRATSMRQFYAAYLQFQTNMSQNPHVVQVTNAGPIWMIETDCPSSTQGVRDQVYNLMNQAGLQTAVLKGKSNITEAKQRICAGAASAVATSCGVAKGKGAPRRIETCWPDIRQQWRLLLDNKTIVAGSVNTTLMQLEIEIAVDAVEGNQNKAQEIAHCIREWERTDRTGYLLYPKISLVASLSNCDYGRAPKNLGKGKGDGGFGQPPPQQQGNGQGGKGDGGLGQVQPQQQQGKGNGLGPGAADPWQRQAVATSSSNQQGSNEMVSEQRRAEQEVGWMAPAARQAAAAAGGVSEALEPRQSYNYATNPITAPLPG